MFYYAGSKFPYVPHHTLPLGICGSEAFLKNITKTGVYFEVWQILG
jgi:hypothetical protein